MATKKTTKKAEPKKQTAIYKGQKYTVLEQNEHRICLTDGTIHFWVKADCVEAD